MTDIILTVGDKIEFLEEKGLWSVPAGDLTPTELVEYVDAHFVNLDLSISDVLVWRDGKVPPAELQEELTLDSDPTVIQQLSDELAGATQECLNRITLRMIEVDDRACDNIIKEVIKYIETNPIDPTSNFMFRVITHHVTSTYSANPTYSMISPESIIRLAGRFAAAGWYIDLNTLTYVDDLFVPVHSDLDRWTCPSLQLYWQNPLATRDLESKCTEIQLIGGVRDGVRFVKPEVGSY